MSMKYIFSGILYASGVLAFYFAIRLLCSEKRKYRENRMISVFGIASGIWSVGFGALLLQTDPYIAYVCRSLAMSGVFLYLIMAQVLVCYISGIHKYWQYFLNGISYTGYIVYFMIIQKDQTVYYLDDMGMTYHFKQGLPNTLYTLYSVVIAINIFSVTIHMIRSSKVKRLKDFGKKFLVVEMLILFGMILDTIFPMIGKSAIPGSSITQFWGMVVLYHAVSVMNRSRINITNMSEFIYYSLSVPVLVYDANQNMKIMNDAASSFLDISQNRLEIDSLPISQLFEVEESDTFSFDGKYKNIDVICRNNQVFCNLTVNKIKDSYGDTIGYIIIVTDLSERMKTMQALEDAKKEAEAANQSKSTFLANMSHEIRTPMNAIVGLSELVLKLDLSEKVREYLLDIKNSSLNLLAIINDILDFSKLESGKMELECENYYTGSLLQDVFLIINTQAKKKGLSFSMDVAPDIPNQLFGDKIRIRGILINLLNNSVKYTNKGSVKLEIQMPKKENGMAQLEFKISDTGVGINKNELELIFESFSQVNRKVHRGTEGTGLGLSIVKGYVDLMGGTILVDSVYGEGSVFTVVIEQKIIDAKPVDAFSKKVQEENAFCIGDIKIVNMRVLIVDDNQVNLKVAKSSLEYYGLQVDTAANGQDSIDLCRHNQYDIVFMDQMMPQMDGIEAMQEIRKISPFYDHGGTCKIIVLTANAISGVREQLIKQGFDEYLGKPIDFKKLERLFQQFIPKENMVMSASKDSSREDTNVAVEEKKPMQESEQLQEWLPTVQVKQGLSYCGGKITDYLSILKLVYESSESQLKELKTLYEQQDIKSYTIQIHGLKGQLLNIGATELSNDAKRLEQAGKEEDTEFIDANLESFVKQYRELLELLKEVLKTYQLIEEQVTEEAPVSDLSQVVKDIQKSLDDFDFARASKLIHSVQKEGLSKEDAALMEELCVLVEDMDIDKMQELLERYQKS